MSDSVYDRIVVGAGLYGLYAARRFGLSGERVCVLERCGAPFKRATYANQARVHLGYHYPRSLATAAKCAAYFERFNREFGFCVNGLFEQVYATSARLGWTSAADFARFCDAVGIPCEETPVSRYFKESMCDGAFLTQEKTYDAGLLKDWFIGELEALPNVHVRYGCPVEGIESSDGQWIVSAGGDSLRSSFIVNAAYAGVNEVLTLAGFEPFDIKYELCEVILCKADERLEKVGLTVMDGPFFSVMPFGETGLHSLTSVTFTPHETSRGLFPEFSCMLDARTPCSSDCLDDCCSCDSQPKSAWPLMSALMRKYLRDDFSAAYNQSLFSVKPILKASELDDSRPTVIRFDGDGPVMMSVLSGKVSTVFELDCFIDDAINGGC